MTSRSCACAAPVPTRHRVLVQQRGLLDRGGRRCGGLGAVVRVVHARALAPSPRPRVGIVHRGRGDHAFRGRAHWVNGGTAHVIRGLGWQPGWELGPVDRPAGGLIASVEHLMTWCRFQWTGTALDGSKILTRASLDRLHTPILTANLVEDIAIDWFVGRIDGVTWIGHGGLTVGYASDLVIVPERGVAVVSLTNGTNGGLVNDAMRRWGLRRFADLDERDPRPDPTLAIDTERFAGTYVHAFSLLTVTPGSEPGTIVVTASRRDDIGPDGWQPPVDPPFTCAFFVDDHAVSVEPSGSPRVPASASTTTGARHGSSGAAGVRRVSTERTAWAPRVRTRRASRSCGRSSPGSPSPRSRRGCPSNAIVSADDRLHLARRARDRRSRA